MQESCSIIANPDGKAWPLAQKIFSLLKQKSSNTAYDLNEVKMAEFRDSEIKPKIINNVRRKVCVFIHDSNANPLNWFTEAALVTYALKHASARHIVNLFPYLKFARQDRKDEARVAISAKVLADMLGLYSDRVISLDIHNPALQGFYSIPFDNLFSFPTFSSHIKQNHANILGNLTVLSPDAGGLGRARACALQLDTTDLAVCNKVRHKAGEVAELQIIGDVKEKDVLIIDDIIDSGGTIVSAAKEAKRRGAKKVYAYATHGLFTKGEEHVCAELDRVFVGDTVLPKEGCKNLEIISFAPLFAEAVHRTVEGHSLSALFSSEFWKMH